MWHYILPLLACVPAWGVWVYASTNPSQTTVAPLSLYGMAFLLQLPIIAQPVLLSYRTATLYGATEQAVGVSVAFAAVSIASIIAPQMYPISDAPFYKPAFISNVAIVGLAIVTYALLPYCLYREAQARKLKTGHAMPLRAMEDAGTLSLPFPTLKEILTSPQTTAKSPRLPITGSTKSTYARKTWCEKAKRLQPLRMSRFETCETGIRGSVWVGELSIWHRFESSHLACYSRGPSFLLNELPSERIVNGGSFIIAPSTLKAGSFFRKFQIACLHASISCSLHERRNNWSRLSI